MSEGNIIDAVCDRIKFDKDRLEKNELGRIEVESFNLTEFWTQFGAAVQALNNYVTKIGFSCGKKPFPNSSEMEPMMQDLLQYYNVMRDLFMVLPPDVGTVLYKAVSSAVVDVMTSLCDFIKSLHNLTENGAKERLTLTGTFWDACNAIDKLPRDNLQATLNVMESEVALASDAQEELETVEQDKVTPGKSEIGINDKGNDTRNPTVQEKIVVSERNRCDASGKDKGQVNSLQLVGAPLRIDKSVFKENKLIERLKKRSLEEPKLIILTGSDFVNLEKWIEREVSYRKTPSEALIQEEINAVTLLIQKLVKIPNDPLYADMTENQKIEKFEHLHRKLRDFWAMKKIILTEHEQFKELVSKYVPEEATNKIPKTVNSSQNMLHLCNQSSKDEQKWAFSSEKSSTVNKIAVAETNQKVLDVNSSALGSADISSPAKDNETLKRPKMEKDLGEPSLKQAKTEFSFINETNINVNIDSRVGVTLQKEVGKSSTNIDLKFKASPSEITVSHTVSGVNQGKRNKPQKYQKKGQQSRNPNTNFCQKTAKEKMMEKFITFIKSNSLTNQSTSDQSNVKPRKKSTRWSSCEGNKLSEKMPHSKVTNHNQIEKCVEKVEPLGKSIHQVEHDKISVSADLPKVNNTYPHVVPQVSSRSLPDIVTTTAKNSVKKREELIHMLMPLPRPHFCSTAFLHYYPNLKIAEALENIERRNPQLKCKDWLLHKEWWDEQGCYNALLWTDIDSLRELEILGFTARVTYRYFALFESVPKESYNKPMPALPDSRPSTSSNTTDSFTPVLVSDYQHGMSCNFSISQRHTINISHSITTSVSSTFVPVEVKDYQHGLPALTVDHQHGSDHPSVYSPSQLSTDSNDPPPEPTIEAEVTPPEVISDFTDLFF